MSGDPYQSLQTACVRATRIGRSSSHHDCQYVTRVEQIIFVVVKKSVTRPSFLVLTHHPENQVFRTILNNHWDLLSASDTTRCLYDAGFKIGSRRNRRLQDILVHSSIPLPRKQGRRINECPQTACIYCDSMDKTGHIYSCTTKQSYESKFNICCQSSNLVYCLQCNTCGKQYVGQTKRKLLERLREHFNNIRKKTTKTTPLAVISTPLDTPVISNK